MSKNKRMWNFIKKKNQKEKEVIKERWGILSDKTKEANDLGVKIADKIFIIFASIGILLFLFFKITS